MDSISTKNSTNTIYVQMHNKGVVTMAFKFLTELKNIVSVGEALDTLSRLVDYIKFRPLATDKPKVTYDSMAVRDLGINAGAVKLVKFFQKVAKEQDPSATMYIQLIKQYFLNAYDWSDWEQEGYDEFESDALWFCDEMEKYLRNINVHVNKKNNEKIEPLGDIILRRRMHAD